MKYVLHHTALMDDGTTASPVSCLKRVTSPLLSHCSMSPIAAIIYKLDSWPCCLHSKAVCVMSRRLGLTSFVFDAPPKTATTTHDKPTSVTCMRT